MFSKLDPKSTGPFRVKSISGVYRQRITVEPASGPAAKPLVVHASHLVPFQEPYFEPNDVDVEEPIAPAPEPEPEPPSPTPGKRRRTRASAMPVNIWDLAAQL